jgi:PKD repeat protein
MSKPNLNNSHNLLGNLLWAIAIYTSIFCTQPALATAAGSATEGSLTCNSLSAAISSNKDYYIFTAGASGGTNTTITGYDFNFGDNQSYAFNFGDNSDLSRTQATATHTYDIAGNYGVSVTVKGDNATNILTATSKRCQVTINIPDPSSASSTSLTNTGPGNGIFIAFFSAFFVGMAIHHTWLGKRGEKQYKLL